MPHGMSGAGRRRRHRMRTVLAFVMTLVVLPATRIAWAQATPEAVLHAEPKNKADAKRLAALALKVGVERLNRRDWAGARPYYQRALELDPSPRALHGLARADHGQKDYVAAYQGYQELIARYPQYARRVRAAANLTALEARTGILRLRFDSAAMSGANLTVDGIQRPTDEVPLTLRVNPGTHELRCERSGREPYARHVKIAAGESVELYVRVGPARAETEATAAPTKGDPKASAGSKTASARVHAWDENHGHMTYVAAHTATPPTIDGILDEAVWRSTPSDSRFSQRLSKPFGLPSKQPTHVQVAYDEQFLYVAITATYSSRFARDDSYPEDELDLLVESEHVGIILDGLHDHQNARGFFVSRAGGRADVEYTNSGGSPNRAWKGIWWSSVRATPDEWTAEMKIPWRTVGVGSHREGATIGLQFARFVPFTVELSNWSAMPPATEFFDTNYFGHLRIPGRVEPGRTLYLRPYVTLGFDQDALASSSRLIDFTGTEGNARVYAGAYARYQPLNEVSVDITTNPDFSAVDPDSAVTNLDRFELLYDEVRPFFIEDTQRFSFGMANAELFYSRRIGVTRTTTGLRQLTPVLGGVKGVYRSNGLESAVMNVGLTGNEPRLSLDSNFTIARTQKLFGLGRRLGHIFMHRADAAGTHMVTGVDGAYSLEDRHFVISGFAASSATDGLGGGLVGGVDTRWQSRDVQVGASHISIDERFDGSMGFFPIGGAHITSFNAGYTPYIDVDKVQQLNLIADVQRADASGGGGRIFDRGRAEVVVEGADDSKATVSVQPSVEYVSQPFTLGADRITINQGRYDVLKGYFAYQTADRAPVVVGVSYTEGDLFDGHQRVPGLLLGANLGRFTARVRNEVLLLEHPTRDLTGYRVSATGTFYYTPQASSRLVIESNTLNQRGIAQLVNTYGFGENSRLMVTFREETGVRGLLAPTSVFDRPVFSAFLTFAYGIYL